MNELDTLRLKLFYYLLNIFDLQGDLTYSYIRELSIGRDGLRRRIRKLK
jgi:hypothetical protein